MKTTCRSLMIFLVFAALLSACSTFSAPPTPTATLPPTETSTPRPTRTPIPTNTPTATLAPTATITLTPTPDVGADFSKTKVLKHGKTVNWNYFITLDLTDKPKGIFYAMVDQNKVYTCLPSAKNERQMTCTGPMAAYDDTVNFVLYAKGVETPLYQTEIYIPAQ